MNEEVKTKAQFMRKKLLKMVDNEYPRSAETTPVNLIVSKENEYSSSSDDEENYPTVINLEAEEAEIGEKTLATSLQKGPAKSGYLHKFINKIVKRRRSMC